MWTRRPTWSCIGSGRWRSVLGAGVVASLLLGSASGLLAQEVARYPRIQGGEWTRLPNLRDAAGRYQARQEHSAVELNGFVYLIGGFVPAQPPPTPTEEDPEPFPFSQTDEVLAYVPADSPAAAGAKGGGFRSLDAASRFPDPRYHHIMSVAHQGQVWSLGGHVGVAFAPTDTVFVFTPNSPDAPEGSWSAIRADNGQPCDPASGACLRLPTARAGGAAVSLGNVIYVIGGVVPNVGSADPVNESIRTTASVLALDTTRFPLTWEEVPPLIESREHFNAVAVAGRAWVFNGRGERSTHMRGVESWAPGEPEWRREPDAPIGTSANVLAAVGDCVYSFGGEFIASTVTATLTASQVFHVPSRTWRLLDATFSKVPLDAAGAASKHGTYGTTFVENGVTRIMAPGGAGTAWFDPMSRVHVFTPPPRCDGA